MSMDISRKIMKKNSIFLKKLVNKHFMDFKQVKGVFGALSWVIKSGVDMLELKSFVFGV